MVGQTVSAEEIRAAEATRAQSGGGKHGGRDEPVHIPTTGLAPQWVGAIVVFSLLVVAAVGLFLLR
jgi:hypothetical protein